MTRIVIRSLEVTEGYLGEAGKIEFGPGLTCILGPKGSFKSTIVEFVRIALGVDEGRIAELLAKDGRMTKALGKGQVRCEIEVDGHRYVASRGVDGGIKVSPRRVSLEGVEVFSQGDVRTLAEDSARRLELVDQSHRERKETLLERRADLEARVAELGAKRVPVLRQLREKKEDVLAGAGAREKLALLQGDPNRPKRTPGLEAARSEHEERVGLLARTEEGLEVRRTMLLALHDLSERGRSFAATAEALAAYSERHGGIPPAQEIAEFFRRASETFRRAEEWCGKEPPAGPTFEKLERSFKDMDRPYERLLEQEKIHLAAIQEENAHRVVTQKAERARNDIAQLEKSEARYREERQRLYDQIDAIDKELHDLREKRVRELNRISPHTCVAIDHGASTTEYEETLAYLLSKALPGLCEAVVANLKPRALLDVVERQDLAAIVRLGARQNDAQRFLERLEAHRELHERLERVELGAEVHINFRDGDVDKPVENLSEGQRATALLPILLQCDRHAAIVIDEPETHLDNRFITESLVELLRRLKKHRQVILVTHNPNLVALTEPEQVIVMDAAGHELAAKPVMGPFKLTKDEVVKIVEGGARAFRERDHCYGIPTLDELKAEAEEEVAW